ncbi:MAG: ferritin-like domain-containing protein [Candidatus Omnitrophica bacterium]|nr:ferritin-like domain-containing protein [Candidatus Omnitrophota bacterium]
MNVYRCRICGEVYIGKEKSESCPFCGAPEKYFVAAGDWTLIMTKELSDITRENLNKALELEIDNTNFYQAVSKKTKDVYVQGMFKGLSKVEREHASTICKHLRIEKPNSDIGSDKAVGSDQDNIKESNRRERRAVKFYSQAASQAVEPEFKDFFKALIQIESDHIVLTD